MQLMTQTSQETEKIIYVFVPIVEDQGTLWLFVFRKKIQAEQNRQPHSHSDKFTDNYRDSRSNKYNRQKHSPTKLEGQKFKGQTFSK